MVHRNPAQARPRQFFPAWAFGLRCSPKGVVDVVTGLTLFLSALGFFFSLLERCSRFAILSLPDSLSGAIHNARLPSRGSLFSHREPQQDRSSMPAATSSPSVP